MIRLEQVNENSLLMRFADSPGKDVTGMIQAWIVVIQERIGSALLDAIPSYTTLLIVVDIQQCPVVGLCQQLPTWESEVARRAIEAEKSSDLISIPVCYDPRVAPDLEFVSEQTGLSTREVIAIHSEQKYTVYALGFLPGFAFLGELDPRLVLPRRSTPRAKLRQGGVGIAARQTGVYPLDSPGGWHIIGHTPQKILCLDGDDHQPSSPFIVGAEVMFDPIPYQEYCDVARQNGGAR